MDPLTIGILCLTLASAVGEDPGAGVACSAPIPYSVAASLQQELPGKLTFYQRGTPEYDQLVAQQTAHATLMLDTPDTVPTAAPSPSGAAVK